MKLRARSILAGSATFSTLLAASALFALGLSKARNLAGFAENAQSKCNL